MSALPQRAVRAHEIKNHLSVIFAIARLLEKDVPAHVQARLARIAVAVRHVNDIVEDDLKPTSCIRACAATASHAELCDLVGERVEDLAMSAGIVLDFHAAEGVVHGDVGALVEMLTNLIGNAIKASPASVTLEAGTTEDGATYFTVEDDGCGMCPEQVASFGRPFRTKFEGGSGVGAAHVLEVVGRHGGELTVASALGRGTRIAIRIPAVT